MCTDKLIINAAITGMIPTKAMTPHVPITPDEIASDAQRCVSAGASILHLHARDEDGLGTWRPDIYHEILYKVRAACPRVILCVSTSGRFHKTFEQRSAVLELTDPAPEMASLTLGSMNFPTVAVENSPDMINALALKMQERQIVPEWECFELGMVEYSHYLIKRGILNPPYYCNLFLGSRGTLSASEFNLDAMIKALPKDVIWAATGIGRFQQQVVEWAILRGGHVRIGLEDNIWLDNDRTEYATNPKLIEKVVHFARDAGRTIAEPSDARAMMGISL